MARSLRARRRLPRILTRPDTISRIGLVPAASAASPPASVEMLKSAGPPAPSVTLARPESIATV
jgi:hypothetical protein